MWVYEKTTLRMMYMGLSNYWLVMILIIISCSCKESNRQDDLENIKANQFMIVDLDRCKSCFQLYDDKLADYATDSSFVVIILSTSKKKADIFGQDNKVNYLWDSTRYFEHYLEKQPVYFKTNK
jgi:hypothetical protein